MNVWKCLNKDNTMQQETELSSYLLGEIINKSSTITYRITTLHTNL